MFELESIDMMIGLVTIYLTLALACTSIVETIEGRWNKRGKNLDKTLRKFLAGKLEGDKCFANAFFAHPLVKALRKDGNGLLPTIPPQVVGQVLQALITKDNSILKVKDAVEKLPGTVEDNPIKGLLMALVTQVNGDAEAFRKAVETHFDAALESASGWVTRHQQRVSLYVAILLVVIGNVDTFTLAAKLSSSPEFRAKLVKIAEQQLEQKPTVSINKDDSKIEVDKEGQPPIDVREAANRTPQETLEDIKKVQNALESSGLTFGWKDVIEAKEALPKEFWHTKILGLIITIFAVSLGAPFWFDLLQRFMQVRRTGTQGIEKKNGK